MLSTVTVVYTARPGYSETARGLVVYIRGAYEGKTHNRLFLSFSLDPTMSDTLTFRKHIFGHAVGAWGMYHLELPLLALLTRSVGHNKPLITLAILIAELRSDVAFTILTNSAMYPKIMGELGKLPRERLKPIEMQIK